MEMSPWKKIAALFAITAPLGIMVSACAVDTTDTTDEPESATTEDEALGTDLTPQDVRDDFDRRGRFCERICFKEFRRCTFSHRPPHVCRRILNRCLDRCRIQPF